MKATVWRHLPCFTTKTWHAAWMTRAPQIQWDAKTRKSPSARIGNGAADEVSGAAEMTIPTARNERVIAVRAIRCMIKPAGTCPPVVRSCNCTVPEVSMTTVQSLLKQAPGQQLAFLAQPDPEPIAETLVALANAEGGTIVLGMLTTEHLAVSTARRMRPMHCRRRCASAGLPCAPNGRARRCRVALW